MNCLLNVMHVVKEIIITARCKEYRRCPSSDKLYLLDCKKIDVV